MKLTKKIIFTGTITTQTGLHIGGTNAAMNIGGPDKFVVRNPLTNLPYIPGSSLKGKMRSLIELFYGETNNGGPSTNIQSHAGQLFGVATKEEKRHSRIIVRDATLIEDKEKFINTDLPYTETKNEVAIDRVTASSNPRTFERVPAGAQFALSMVLNVYDTDNEEALISTLKTAIKLLHDDYLGGQGSRGYGHIHIDLNEETRTRDYYEHKK
jgi:CRISPR-associated protein Csm3